MISFEFFKKKKDAVMSRFHNPIEEDIEKAELEKLALLEQQEDIDITPEDIENRLKVIRYAPLNSDKKGYMIGKELTSRMEGSTKGKIIIDFKHVNDCSLEFLTAFMISSTEKLGILNFRKRARFKNAGPIIQEKIKLAVMREVTIQRDAQKAKFKTEKFKFTNMMVPRVQSR